jgi:signal transduction histidine kinase
VSAARLDDAESNTTWGPLTRRLFALAMGSVVVSFVLAGALIQLRSPPPHPGMVRAALNSLRLVLDEPAARAAEVHRLLRDAQLELALYADDRRLVESNIVDVPALPVDLPPPNTGRDERGPDERRGRGGPGGPGGPGGHRHGPGPMLPMRPSTFVHTLESPSGQVFYVAMAYPGEGMFITGAFACVAVVLGLLSLAFAATLARPLRELGRATAAFGRGDVSTRVDEQKAGAFFALAHTFNNMAERVTSARRAERELLANVSHELRTPLSRIRVALDIADEGDPQLARESLSDISEDLTELEQIINDILTATRLESGQLTSSPPLRLALAEPASLAAAAATRFRAHHTRHTLVLDVQPDLPELHIDAVLVRRALDNFLDNAGKYAAPASTVILRAALDGDDVVFTVVDRGPGISYEDQQRLFTPFFRADKSRTRTTGGVGLGLVLSRRIVEAHGGSVVLTSEPGVGTTVVVRLPLDGVAAAP